MKYLVDLLVNGLKEADLDQLLDMRNHGDASRAVATYCLACAPHLEPDEQSKARDELDQVITSALSNSKMSDTASTAVLLVALRWSQQKQRGEEGIRYARMLSELGGERVPSRLRLVATLEELRVWRNADDSNRYDAAHARTVSLKPVAGTSAWLSLWSNYLLEMINRRHASAAEAVLKKLEPMDKKLKEHGMQSFAAQKAYYCFSFGRLEEGLQLFGQPDLAEMCIHWGREAQIYMMLMIFSGRLSEAEARLNEYSSSLSEKERTDLDVFKGYVYLARRDFNAARELARYAIAGSDGMGAHHSNAVLLLANVELVERQAACARGLLQILDPHEERPYFDMQWARLYMLEENFPKAAVFFSRILEQGIPEYVEDRVRFAYEMSALDLATLYRLATASATNVLSTSLTDRVHSLSCPGLGLVRHETVRASDNGNSSKIDLEWIGDSAESQKVRDLIREYARLDAAVLISGETGTGKEVAARLLHAEGNRRSASFMPIHCGALSEQLMEAELFGHVKGAFTGAADNREGLLMAAGEGMVFLDEIHTMPPRLQAALLRVLENGEVRPVGSDQLTKMKARIVAATNENLLGAVAEGRFREDLYYRLNVLTLRLPPLRERTSDILALTRHFLRSRYEDFGVALDPGFSEALVRCPWLGNVRELRHAIERTAILAGNVTVLTASHLQHAAGESPLSGTMSLARKPSPTHADGRFRASDTGTNLSAQIPGNPRNSRLRLARLKEEFKRYRELSRSQVVELLGCAPDTAGRDLKALEAEGFVRRVETSSHPRTGYYELAIPE